MFGRKRRERIQALTERMIKSTKLRQEAIQRCINATKEV